MRNLTKEELDVLVEASDIWTELQADLREFAGMRMKAAGRYWEESGLDYLGTVTQKGLHAVGVSYDGDEGVDTSTIEFTVEELFNLEALHAKNTHIAKTIESVRQADAEKKQREYRKNQYETLKKEFEA